MSTIKVTNINVGVSERDTRDFFSFVRSLRRKRANLAVWKDKDPVYGEGGPNADGHHRL